MTNNDKVAELTTKEFEEFTKKGLVFIDFFCRMVHALLDDGSNT